MIYLCFQMTFAMITPALIVGAFAERMKFAALALFIPLWVTFIYFPIAHMVWYWAGPDAIDAAAKALAAATDDAAKKTAQEALDAVNADAGQIFLWGAIDFAGGTVVHINAGIAGLVGAIMIGKRTGFGKELMPPHSLVMTMIGASLLWVGWFGFNVGSNLEANGTRGSRHDQHLRRDLRGGSVLDVRGMADQGQSLAARHRHRLRWRVWSRSRRRPASPARWARSCSASSPASVCLFFCSVIKNMFGYDDSLDVFGVHCVGGIVGALGTGILVNPALGGTGIIDYTTGKIAEYDFAAQMIAQSKAVLTTLVWSGVGSAILFFNRRHHRRPACLGRQGARRPRSHRPRRTRLQYVSSTLARRGVYPAPPLAEWRLRSQDRSLFLLCSPRARCRRTRWLIGP